MALASVKYMFYAEYNTVLGSRKALPASSLHKTLMTSEIEEAHDKNADRSDSGNKSKILVLRVNDTRSMVTMNTTVLYGPNDAMGREKSALWALCSVRISPNMYLGEMCRSCLYLCYSLVGRYEYS